MTMDAKAIKIELEVCESEMDRLSPWEQQFIENVSDAFAREGTLSPSRCDKLHQIYEKVV